MLRLLFWRFVRFWTLFGLEFEGPGAGPGAGLETGPETGPGVLVIVWGNWGNWGGFPFSVVTGTLYNGRHTHDEPARNQNLLWKGVRVNHALTLWNPNHECVNLLAATGSLWMRTLCKRTSSLRDLHHESVEMLTFRRSMSTNAWLAWKSQHQQTPSSIGLSSMYHDHLAPSSSRGIFNTLHGPFPSSIGQAPIRKQTKAIYPRL